MSDLKEDGTKARGIIAICIALLLGAALMGSFFLNPSQSQQANVNLIIGGLLTSMATVVGFYFGSSSGAKVLVSKLPPATSPDAPTGTPDDPVSVTETVAPPPAPPPDRSKADKVIAMMKTVRPDASDDQIKAAVAALHGIDVAT